LSRAASRWGEYRAPYQGGGAYSEDFTVIDLSTGNATAVDRFAMSAATFRGGGGGPRRPVGSVVLGPDRVAWTRLIEGPGGSVTGELRVALLAEPGRVTPIGSSPEWIAALGIDARRLLYVLGGKSEDQLHVRDLDNGVERIVATGPVGDQQVVGGIPGFNRAFLAGDWAIWLDTPGATAGKVRAVNLASGEERTIGAGGSSCDALSVGTRYVSWYCSGERVRDPRHQDARADTGRSIRDRRCADGQRRCVALVHGRAQAGARSRSFGRADHIDSGALTPSSPSV